MSASTTWTLEDLTALETAMAQGVKEVQYNDRKVTYRTLQEMKELRELIKRSLGLNKRSGRILCEAKKGIV